MFHYNNPNTLKTFRAICMLLGMALLITNGKMINISITVPPFLLVPHKQSQKGLQYKNLSLTHQ